MAHAGGQLAGQHTGEDMGVRAADGGIADADQNVLIADFRHRHVQDFQLAVFFLFGDPAFGHA